MTAPDRVAEEVRAALSRHADQARVPPDLTARVVRGAERVRRRRRYAAVGAAAVGCLIALSPVALEATNDDGPEPAGPTPTPARTEDSPTPIGSGPAVWSETLPGLELPVGEPLRAYAVDDTVVVDGVERALPGTAGDAAGAGTHRLTQLFTTPSGVVAVTETAGGAAAIHLLTGGNIASVGGPWQLSGSVAVGLDPQGETRIALATDAAVFEGPVANPVTMAEIAAPLGAIGFLDGDPLFMDLDEPTRIVQFHRNDAGGAVEELVGDFTVPMQDSRFADLVRDEDQAFALYTTHEDLTCTFGYALPGEGVYQWNSCDPASDATMVVGARYGAVGGTIHHLLTTPASFVTTFSGSDWTPTAASEAFVIEPLGWETSAEVIFRVVSYEVDNPSDGSAQPRYVGVRCQVETADCERLPHPVEMVPRNISDVGTRD